MGTSSAAQLEQEPQEHYEQQSSRQTVSPLKVQAAERLAAHRALRGHSRPERGPELFETSAVETRSSFGGRAIRIAAAVADRYAQSQSYREFLAAEAGRAVQLARAAAEVAARNAEAIAVAQQQLLSDLEDWAREADTPELLPQPIPVAQRIEPAALTVRLYEESVRRSTATGVSNAVPHEALDEEERDALDEEISFRQAPVFEELMEPAMPLSANLIEFPRQLVAPRKARPRLAEGPLREEADAAETHSQLRIFEVEADQISTVVEAETSLPEWSSIRLSACTATEAEAVPAYAVSQPPVLEVAPSGLRLMAATVDGVILLGAFLGFVTTAAYTAGQLPTGQLAALGAAVVFAVFFLLYQLLFFTFAEATPGMRYARIGLCTLGDDNPTRAAMRRRIVAVLLAACPLGLGLAWAVVDADGLGWHDRISRMYQRSY